MNKILKFLGIKGIAIIFVSSLLFVIALQNLAPVSLNILFWRFFEVPKLYLILLSYFVGVASGVIFLFIHKK